MSVQELAIKYYLRQAFWGEYEIYGIYNFTVYPSLSKISHCLGSKRSLNQRTSKKMID